MKNMLVILIISVLMSCNSKKKLPTGLSFDYLVGNWERTNGKSGSRTYESWKKMDKDTYSSISVVLVQGDTVYKETVRLEKRGDTIFYIADVPQNEVPTEFKVVHQDQYGFSAINPENDFPKRIKYEKIDAGQLNAIISGNGKEVLYQFDKRN